MKPEKYLKEQARLDAMYEYEEKYYALGKKIIAGVDEAGRGPLAGPVVAAAVILPKDLKIMGVNDSKKLSASKRTELCKIIREEAVAVGVGIVSPQVIDEINILQATFKAMTMAIMELEIKPDCVLFDGNAMPPSDVFGEAVIKGDSKSVSIAAASIIAKVTRDEIMIRLDEIYPEYAFKSCKGYGTAAHISAIKQYGLCPEHRTSFTKNIITS